MSHLTVSYVSQTPAGTPAAGAAPAAPAADNPLGFLGALLDQILAGGADAIQTATTGDGKVAVDLPGLLDALPEAIGRDTADKPAFTADLVAALTTKLDQLQARIEAGATPAPAETPSLTRAIDALIATIEAGPTQPATSTGVDPLGEISAQTTVSATVAPAIPLEQVTQLLTDLGLIEPQPVEDVAAQAPSVAAPAALQIDIAALRDRLDALSRSLAPTAPDLARKLETLAAKLEPVAADPQLAASLGLAVTETAPDPDAPTIAHIIRSLLGHADPTDDPVPVHDTATVETTAPAAGPVPQVHDDLLQILATLGLDAPPAAATSSPAATQASTPVAAVPAATTSAAVPPPLLRLSTQLTQVATALTATSPELARKLEAVATRLVSTDADANLLGKLTSTAAEPDGTALDRLVQSLIESKPVAPSLPTAAPQIAAPGELPLPAPIAPSKSKSAVTEVKAAPPEPAPVTADSAPKPTQNVTLTAAAREPASDPQPEAKAEARASATPADAAKSDPAAQAPQPQPQAAPAAAQQARPLPAAYQPVANSINMGQLAFEMVRQVHQGSSRFTIRLDPPELGRVDVKMHVDNTGTVNARLTVDRAETLDLFQRDRQSLERALSQAGLDTGKTNLEFSLRQQHNPFAGMMGGDQRQQHPGHGSAPRFGLAAADEVASMPAVTLYRGTASAAGVNIFA